MPNKILRTRRCPVIAAALFVSAVAFQSCDNGPTTQSVPTQTGDDPAQDQVRALTAEELAVEFDPVRAFTTSQPNVKECEFDILRHEFEQRFLVPSIGGTAWARSEVAVRWRDIEQAASGTNVGLVFHYGLRGTYFQVGFNVVPITNQHVEHGEVVYDYDTAGTPFYPIEGGRANVRGKLHLWKQAYAEAYHLGVKVLRHTNATQRLDLLWGIDTECYLLPWTSELEDLGSQNTVAANDSLIISSIAGPDQRVGPYSSGFRHQLCAYIKKGNTPQLNDVIDVDNPFYKKAAELGTPCPPRCKKFILPQPGAEFICP